MIVIQLINYLITSASIKLQFTIILIFYIYKYFINNIQLRLTSYFQIEIKFNNHFYYKITS
jgi:hypothetical protein